MKYNITTMTNNLDALRRLREKTTKSTGKKSKKVIVPNKAYVPTPEEMTLLKGVQAYYNTEVRPGYTVGDIFDDLEGIAKCDEMKKFIGHISENTDKTIAKDTYDFFDRKVGTSSNEAQNMRATIDSFVKDYVPDDFVPEPIEDSDETDELPEDIEDTE